MVAPSTPHRPATRARRPRIGAYVELPTRSVIEWTPPMVRAAQRDADGGNLAAAADVVDAILGDDRVQGVLSTRTHGLLGLPIQFFGAEDQVAALEGQRGLEGQPAIPGDWWTMHPEAELAQLMAWGILLGVGLAERVPPPEREPGEREVPTLRIWHPRWLRHDWHLDAWFLATQSGEDEITPGDGRWILYTPYGSNRPWTQGAWRPLAFAWLLKQFALHDRARQSEIQGGAARVAKAPEGAKETSRRAMLRDLRRMGRDNAMVLPDGWDYRIVEATGQTHRLYDDQIEWADRAIAITLAGQFVTTEGTKGFSNGNIHAAIKRDLITFTAESLVTTLHQQSLRYWAEDNWGDRTLAPWPRWDTSPPVDKADTAAALSTLGDAVAKLDAALAPSGKRVDAIDLASRFGLATLDLPPATDKAPSIALAPTDVAKVIRVNEARASAGLGPLLLQTGELDPDGDLTVDEFAAKRAAARAPSHGVAQAQEAA